MPLSRFKWQPHRMYPFQTTFQIYTLSNREILSILKKEEGKIELFQMNQS